MRRQALAILLCALARCGARAPAAQRSLLQGFGPGEMVMNEGVGVYNTSTPINITLANSTFPATTRSALGLASTPGPHPGGGSLQAAADDGADRPGPRRAFLTLPFSALAANTNPDGVWALSVPEHGAHSCRRRRQPTTGPEPAAVRRA